MEEEKGEDSAEQVPVPVAENSALSGSGQGSVGSSKDKVTVASRQSSLGSGKTQQTGDAAADADSKTTSMPSEHAVHSVPSGKTSAAAASSGGSLKTAASIITRISTPMVSESVERVGRVERVERVPAPMGSRSAISIPVPSTAGSTSRVSIVSRVSRLSRASRGTTLTGPALSPGLQELIERLADTKDVGLIAYLMAIPGEPYRASKPPAAVIKLQRKQSAKPRSIMKISKPQIRFEPTYRMDPMRPFRAERAHAMVKNALELGLEGASYSGQWAMDACRILAAYITQCVKGIETHTPGSRYKIGTMVSVLERNWQGVHVEMATLWDSERDRYVNASVHTTTMIAIAVVYSVYWE